MELKNKFMQKVEVTDSCWIWNGYLNNTGYGQVPFYHFKTRLAHRVSYKLFIGNFDDSLCVCHKCDNPKCVNPEHLFLGTHKDNALDKVSKGRGVYWNKNKTHCKNGHEFTPENTRLQKNGRLCRTCRNEQSKIRMREYHAKTKTQS